MKSTKVSLSVSECPPTLSGKRRFYCPSRNEQNEWICVTSDQICDTKIDCPKAQDEEELMCFYHRPVSHFFFIIVNTFGEVSCCSCQNSDGNY